MPRFSLLLLLLTVPARAAGLLSARALLPRVDHVDHNRTAWLAFRSLTNDELALVRALTVNIGHHEQYLEHQLFLTGMLASVAVSRVHGSHPELNVVQDLDMHHTRVIRMMFEHHGVTHETLLARPHIHHLWGWVASAVKSVGSASQFRRRHSRGCGE